MISFCLLLAWVRAQELPRESKRKAKCLGQSCSLRGPGVRFRQFQHLLLPQNLHQHWFRMTLIERIPSACGPWGQSVRAALPQGWLPWGMRLWWGCHFQRWQMAGCADAGMFFAICWV